jgi:hypothetical protein
MHTKFVTTLIDHDCPDDKNEKNCALRKYLKEKPLLFKTSKQDKTLLTPTAEPYRLARAEYIQAIEKMNSICRDCLEGKSK